MGDNSSCGRRPLCQPRLELIFAEANRAAGLAREPDCLRLIEQVRDGEQGVESAARRFVRRADRGRRALEQMIETAAEAAARGLSPQLAVCLAGGIAIPTGAVPVTLRVEPTPYGPITFAVEAAGVRYPQDPHREGTHARNLPLAATLIARFGARHCLVCDTRLASDGQRRRYCDPCSRKVTARQERSERDWTSRLLIAVADARGVA